MTVGMNWPEIPEGTVATIFREAGDKSKTASVLKSQEVFLLQNLTLSAENTWLESDTPAAHPTLTAALRAESWILEVPLGATTNYRVDPEELAFYDTLELIQPDSDESEDYSEDEKGSGGRR